MKTIGMIGGMSWESTVSYYQIVNRTVKEKLGGLHSAKCILYSVDFAEIEECQVNGQWDKSAEILVAAAQSLERAGADFIIICTNTMHKVFSDIQKQITIPILHIAEETVAVLLERQIDQVILLGTKYTMQQQFYKQQLVDRQIEVIIPNEEDMEIVNQIIFDELCLGIISEASKEKMLSIIRKLAETGAQGVILGCTEIGMLIQQNDIDLALFDTTQIHAWAAAVKAIAD